LGFEGMCEVVGTGSRIATFLGVLMGSHAVLAQVPPTLPGGLGTLPSDAGSARRALPELMPGPLPQPNVVLPPLGPPAQAAPQPGGPRVMIRHVRVEGSTVLPDSVIDEIVAPFLGRELNNADLEDLRLRLTQAYVSRGYITSGAVLPDQKIENETVTYRIVEGQINDIRVEGTDWLRPDYVRNRLARAAGKPVNIDAVEERVQLLLQDPVVERMNVELVPGVSLGEATLRAHVVEAKPYSLFASIANDEPPDVGSIHGQLSGTVRNLTGWGDALLLRYGRTYGVNEGGVGWAIPVTVYDTLLAFHYDYDGSGVVAAEFQGLNINSTTQTLGVALSQPVYRTATEALTLTLDFDYRWNENFLLGEPFSFTPGEDNGRVKVPILRFSQDWLSRGSEQVIALRSTFSQGLQILNATNTGQKPNANFLAWLGQAQYVHSVFGDSQVIARADVQLATEPLFTFEQLPIGGPSTVRGYRVNTLVRDNGVIASVEGRIPVFSLPLPGISSDENDGQVQLAPFYDFGTGWNTHSPTPRPRDISSVGLGFRWDITGVVSAELYYGYPLRHFHIPPSQRNLQDDSIYFRVAAKVF